MNLNIAFLGLVAMAALLLSTVSSDKDPTCTALLTEAETILWIGLLRTRFILITNALNVYDMPPSALDTIGRRLHLSRSRPLKNAYPAMNRRINEGYFIGGRKHLTVVDQTSEYLYMETAQLDTADVYDLLKKTPPTRYAINDHSVRPSMQSLTVAISSSEPLTFYLIIYEDSTDTGGQLTSVTFKGGQTLPSSTVIQRQQTFYLCVGSSADEILLAVKSCKKAKVPWRAVAGFADMKNFYLLANRTVIIFATSAFATPGLSVRFFQISYTDFFVCSPQKRALLIILICLGLAVTLFCCFLACFLCVVCCNRSKPSQPAPSMMNTQQQQVSVQMEQSINIETQPSVKPTKRSNTTKKMSKSKRTKKQTTKSTKRTRNQTKTARRAKAKRTIDRSSKSGRRSHSYQSTNTIRSRLKQR